MSEETSQREQPQVLQVLAKDATDRRLADRLVRAGVSAASTPLTTALSPARGTVYIATGTRAGDVDYKALARAGAHLWVVPPFSVASSALTGNSSVMFAPAHRRDGVYLSPGCLAAVRAGVVPAQRLRILYRDCVASGATTVLAASTAGEVLAGALPRTSNLYGQVIITTAQLGTASAQTDLDDVATFVRALMDWCVASEVVRLRAPAESAESAHADASEHGAQIVLLALALTQTIGHRERGDGAAPQVTLAQVGPIYEQVTTLLGSRPEAQAFQAGWAWLRDRGILRYSTTETDETTIVDMNLLRTFVARWQLQPRLRRLAARIPPQQ